MECKSVVKKELSGKELDKVLSNMIDFITQGDHESLVILLENIVIDISEIKDEKRGLNMAHIVCLNNDHNSLDIIIYYALVYWQGYL
jgi:hypothetical protein